MTYQFQIHGTGLPRAFKILESPGIGEKVFPGPGKSLNLCHGP